MDLQDRELREKRREWDIAIGKIYARTFEIPQDAVSTLVPRRGDAVTLRDVALSQTAPFTPRVKSNPVIRSKKNGMCEVTISLIQAEAYE